MPNPSDYLLSGHVANKTGFRSKKRNIPFYNPDDETIKVKITYDEFADSQDFLGKVNAVTNKLANRFILHYYPEFYPYLKDASYTAGIAILDDAFADIKRMFKESLEAGSLVYYVPLDPFLKAQNKHMVLGSISSFTYDLLPCDVRTLKKNSQLASTARIYKKIQAMTIPAPGAPLTFTTRSPLEIRELLELANRMPSWDDALSLFNQDQKITNANDQTTIIIGGLMENNNLMNDGLSSFQSEIAGFGGLLPLPFDFNAIQKSMMFILNVTILKSIVEELTDIGVKAGTGRSKFTEFGDADSVTIYFGKKRRPGPPRLPSETAIGRITYVINEESPQENVLKTGYMTNVKYNKEFQDPLTLSTLKNYEYLLQRMRLAAIDPNGPPFSFTDFINDSSGDFGLPSNFIWDELPAPGPPVKNAFLKEAVQMGLVDLKDTKALEKGFVESMSPAEMRKLRTQVRQNPEIFKKVFEANKTKALKTGQNVAKGIASILNGNLPGVKKNSKLGLLLRSLGIDEIAKEAMICATLGMGPSMGRIAQAAANAMQTVGQRNLPPPGMEINSGPYQLPSPPMPAVKIPPIDIKKIFKTFTIDGDMWKEILKIMLDTLQEMVMEIVKGLAELLKDLCELTNPFASDFGENDLADLVQDNLTDDAAGLPNISNPSALNQLFERDDMTFDNVMKYFRDLSAILSSMEICFLFTDRDEVSYDTMEKILDFNAAYDDVHIRNTLNSYGAVMGFFANLSRYVDFSDFCNKIASDLVHLNHDNLCLLEAKAPDAIVDILSNIADGIKLDQPEINLDCPLRPGFIENPLVNDTIPDLINTIVRVVEMEFTNSVSSVTQILKEPTVVTDRDAEGNIDPAMKKILDAVNAARGTNEAGTGTESDSDEDVYSDVRKKPGKATRRILKKVRKAMGEIPFMDTSNLEETCNIDLTEAFGVEAGAVQDVMNMIITILDELLQDPEFLSAINDLEGMLGRMSAGGDNDPQPVSTKTFQFPRKFRNQFRNYMPKADKYTTTDQEGLPSFTGGESIVEFTTWPLRVSSGPSGHFSSEADIPNLQFTSISYRDMKLTFNLGRTQTKPTWVKLDDAAAAAEIQAKNAARALGVAASGEAIKQRNPLPEGPFGTPIYGKDGLAISGSINETWPAGVIVDLASPNDTDGVLRQSIPYYKLQSPTGGLDKITISYPNYSGLAYEGDNWINVKLDSDLIPGGSFDLGFNADRGSANALGREFYLGDLDESPYNIHKGNPYVNLFAVRVTEKLIFPSSAPTGPGEHLLTRRQMASAGTSGTGATTLIEERIPGAVQAGSTGQASHLHGRWFRVDDVKSQINGLLFPAAFAGLVESAFDYIEANGIFDMERLNAVNFFHDNRNCIPDNVADFLDIDGILAILKDEMLDALCYDEDKEDLNPMGGKIRDVIRYGLFLLLTQIHIAQFMIKNIFVLSAFKVEDIMASQLITDLLARTVREQMTAFLQTEPVIGHQMVQYFSKKAKRPSIVSKGGFMDRAGNMVFPVAAPTTNMDNFDFENSFDGFSIDDFPAIIEYVTKLRIFDSKKSVSNAMERTSAMTPSKSIDKIFLEDILTVQPMWFGDHMSTQSSAGSVIGSNLGLYLEDGNENIVRFEAWAPSMHHPGVDLDDITEHLAGLDAVRLNAKTKAARNGAFGRFVLERVVTWDQAWVHAGTLEGRNAGTGGYFQLLADLAGPANGMEISLFKHYLHLEGGHHVAQQLLQYPQAELSDGARFSGLAIKHRIVYYLPTGDDIVDEDGDTGGGLFYLHGADLHPRQRHDPLGLRRIVLEDLDTSIPLGGGDTNSKDKAFLEDIEYFSSSRIRNSEISQIEGSTVYQNLFGKAFNKELIMLIPVIYNFYLTNSHFPEIDDRFRAPKYRCLQVFKDSVRDENNFTSPVPDSVGAKRLGATDPKDPLLDLGFSALDFLLKMLIETPIKIFKGVSEIIDPHVAISKIIKDVSGAAFNNVAKVIDASPPVIALREPLPHPRRGQTPVGDPNGEPIEADATLPAIAPAITGEGILSFLLCMVTMGINEGLDDVSPKPPGWNKALKAGILYPKINIKGVDFLGTLPGIFMLPPFIFGIIYLLLSLLMKELEDDLNDLRDEASDPTAPPADDGLNPPGSSACPDPVATTLSPLNPNYVPPESGEC